MSQVDFGENKDHGFSNLNSPTERRSGMAGLLIKWGITDNEKTAEIILLISGISFLILSGVFMYATIVGFDRPTVLDQETVLQNRIEKIPEGLPDQVRENRIQKLKEQVN